MVKQPAQTKPPSRPPRLIGVYVRPREEHWAEVLTSVDSAQAAVDESRFAPGQVALPKPRMQPVYEAADGRRVTLEETPEGFATRPFDGGPLLEMTASGGLAGGYLATGQAPPLPLAGGASATAWADAYYSRVPEQVDVGARQERWGSATQAYTDAVSDRTSPDRDEWRRKYFARICEAAAQRDAVYRSAEAAPKGPRHFTQDPDWARQEYHNDLFAKYGRAANQERQDAAVACTAAPEGVFAHSAAARTLALAGALQKNGAGLAATFHQALEPEVSARIGGALQTHLRERAKAAGGQGAAADRLRAALDVLKQLNEAGGGKMLAGMLENLAKGNGKGADLDQLKGDFIKNLAQMGLNQGLERLLGKDAAGLLTGTGVTGLFADAAKNIIMDEKPGLADGARTLLDELPNKLIDLGFDKLLGQVDDRSSMAKQLLAKYKDQIKNLLKKLLSKDGLKDLQKQWDAIWKGTPSKASVKMGLAIGFCEADLVMVNGLPVTRVNDECLYPPPEPPGKFFQGNPTIKINGEFPAGEIHAAINGKGTIATPLNLSPNVLMGQATISLKIKVKVDAPKGTIAGASNSESRGSAGGTGVSGGSAATPQAPAPSVANTPPPVSPAPGEPDRQGTTGTSSEGEGTKFGIKGEAGIDGGKPTLGASVTAEKELSKKEVDLGIFQGEDVRKANVEVGQGLEGPQVKIETDETFSLKNRLGDELYCKTGIEGTLSATPGVSATEECGIKGALDKDTKLGVSASFGISTDPKFSANCSTETQIDVKTGECTQTTTCKVETPIGGVSVSEENKLPQCPTNGEKSNGGW